MKKSKLKRPVKSKEQLLTEMAVKRKGYLKVSACWIVKNDAKRLGTSIGSVKQFVDELIVVDTGSTDNTIETARNLGAKIFQQPWADDFSAPRNLAIENATGDWILFLDSDEFIPAELAFNLRPAINIAVQQKKHAMLINLVNVDTDKHNDIIDSTYLCRIFNAFMKNCKTPKANRRKKRSSCPKTSCQFVIPVILPPSIVKKPRGI